jgi:hypothetical protein
MRWQGREGSSNIEDRRRSGSRGAVAGGGIGLLAVVAIGYFLGVDLTPLLDQQQLTSEPAELTEADVQAGEFVSVVLNDTEEIWSEIFRQQIGQPYTPTTLVLYKGVTQSACGGASGRRVRSTVPETGRSTSTRISSSPSAGSSARAGILRRPMSSRTRSPITCRTSSASCRRRTTSAPA